MHAVMATPEAPARLEPDVEVGDREHAAQRRAHQHGPPGELRHAVAAPAIDLRRTTAARSRRGSPGSRGSGGTAPGRPRPERSGWRPAGEPARSPPYEPGSGAPFLDRVAGNRVDVTRALLRVLRSPDPARLPHRKDACGRRHPSSCPPSVQLPDTTAGRSRASHRRAPRSTRRSTPRRWAPAARED